MTYNAVKAKVLSLLEQEVKDYFASKAPSYQEGFIRDAYESGNQEKACIVIARHMTEQYRVS